MSKTEEQREVEKLLSSLENMAASDDPAPRYVVLNVVKICRLQQDEIRELQEIPRNIGLGLKVVGYIGAAAGTVITIFGGILAIRGYFKG